MLVFPSVLSKRLTINNELFSGFNSEPKPFNELTINDVKKISVHFQILELNHFPYSDSHYQNIVDIFRLLVHELVDIEIIPLAAFPKISHMITKEDFLNAAQRGDNYDLNELSEAYQDLFHEDLVINTQSL